MIGKLELPNNDVVILEDDGSVRSNNDITKQLIEDLLDIYKRAYTPAHGRFGVRFLNDLAKKTGSRVDIENKPEDPPGLIR